MNIRVWLTALSFLFVSLCLLNALSLFYVFGLGAIDHKFGDGWSLYYFYATVTLAAGVVAMVGHVLAVWPLLRMWPTCARFSA